MHRRIIDADNSCLFNAIGLLALRKLTMAPQLRDIIRVVVLEHPELYDEAILGKDPSEYVVWIAKTTTWGGEVEVNILSSYFKVCDIVTRNQNLIMIFF